MSCGDVDQELWGKRLGEGVDFSKNIARMAGF
jgi:hypothetical protein